MRYKLSFLILFVCLLAVRGLAQITGSSMSGFVKDTGNVGLPGAVVKITHEPSGTVYGTATENDGSFSVMNMRVGGPYKVEVSFIGYPTVTVTNIMLTLAEPYYLRVRMEPPGTTLNEVVIGSRNPIINNERTGAATNINSTQIAALPTISRSITDYTRLSPYSGPSNGATGTYQSNSFGGRDGRYNNVQINGANFNNAFGLNSNLLPGGEAQPIPLDAIEEIQVGFAPFDVRNTGFTGAYVNAITRSGSNNFVGSAYTYYRNESFTGKKVDTANLVLSKTSNQIYGARLGGPIIKNKLFFFVNGEYEKKVYPGVNWVSKDGTGNNVSRTPADSMQMVRDFLKSKFGYDPGAFQGFGDQFTNKNTKLLARLDYNISEKHKAYLSFSQLTGTSDQLTNSRSAANGSLSNSRIGQNSLAFENSLYGFKNTVTSIAAEISSNFSNKLANQLLATYTMVRDQRTSNSSPFPMVDIVTKSSTSDNIASFGYELFSYKNDLKNNSLNIMDNVTYNTGRHNFLAGASFEHLYFGNSFLPYGAGYYRYQTFAAFLKQDKPIGFGYTYPFVEQGDNTYVKLSFGMGGLYLQDKYNVNERLAITGGIRLDLPFYFNDLPTNKYIDTLSLLDKNGNPTHYDVSKWPRQRVLASPRVGFNWDATGDRKVQVRGGTGIFTGRVPFVWFTNQPGNTATLTNQVQSTNSTLLSQIQFGPDVAASVAALPDSTRNKFFAQHAGTSVPSQIAFVSPDFKMPQVWRSDLGADVRLPWYDLIGTAEAVYTRDIVNVYQRNANQPAPDIAYNDPSNRPAYSAGANRLYSNISGAYILENTNKGESFSFTIGVARTPRKGLFGSVYYTGTYATEVSPNPGSQASSAWSGLAHVSTPNDQVVSYSQYLTPQRVVANLSYRFEYFKHLATTVTLYYEGASMGRFQYRYSSDFNKDGANADLMYIPTQADIAGMKWKDLKVKDAAGNEVVYTGADQAAALEHYIVQDKYLSTHRGQNMERFGAKYPMYHRFDFKLLQDVFTDLGKNRNTLQVSVDILNVGNLLNPAWGNMQRLVIGSGNNSNLLSATVDANNNVTYQLATYVDDNKNTVLPTKTFRRDVSTISTWGMQLGLRYLFR